MNRYSVYTQYRRFVVSARNIKEAREIATSRLHDDEAINNIVAQ